MEPAANIAPRDRQFLRFHLLDGELPYGDANPTVAATLHKLGLAWYIAKDLKKSIQCLEEAISIYRKVFGEAHNKTQQVVRFLAKIEEEQRRCCCVLV